MWALRNEQGQRLCPRNKQPAKTFGNREPWFLFCCFFFVFLRANPLLELSNPNRTTGKEIDAEVVSWSYLIVANGVQLGYSVFKDHRRTVNVQKFFLSCSHLKL